jgi:phage terminase large subunit
MCIPCHDEVWDGVLTLWNGSEIFLYDLLYYPADPNYDRVGSTEFTGTFIDEANQIIQKAKDVVKSRIRYKLTTFDLLPRLLLTCNPAKNYV